MKRKEEIVTQAVKEQSQLHQPLEWGAGFISGANWADRTMLDRACEWLRLRISVDVPIETNENGEPLADSWLNAQMERAKAAEEFIAEFRKAMEGE